MLEKDQTSNRPCRPSLGSQKLRPMSWGERANEPGGYGFPRSSRQTAPPSSARRHAITEPPKPDLTTTTSKSDRPPVITRAPRGPYGRHDGPCRSSVATTPADRTSRTLRVGSPGTTRAGRRLPRARPGVGRPYLARPGRGRYGRGRHRTVTDSGNTEEVAAEVVGEAKHTESCRGGPQGEASRRSGEGAVTSS